MIPSISQTEKAILDHRNRLQSRKDGAQVKCIFIPYQTALQRALVQAWLRSPTDSITAVRPDEARHFSNSGSEYDIHGRRMSAARRAADAARSRRIIQERESASGAGIREDGFSFYCGKSARRIVKQLIVPPVRLEGFGKNNQESFALFRPLAKPKPRVPPRSFNAKSHASATENATSVPVPQKPKRSLSLFDGFRMRKVAPSSCTSTASESGVSGEVGDRNVAISQTRVAASSSREARVRGNVTKKKKMEKDLDFGLMANGSSSSSLSTSDTDASSKSEVVLRGATKVVAQQNHMLEGMTREKFYGKQKKSRPCRIS